MLDKHDYRIIVIGKGHEIATGYKFDSVHFELRFNAITPYVNMAIPFSINDTVTPLGVLSAALKLRQLIKMNKPHVVHALWGSTTALIGVLATCFTTTSLIITFNGNDLIENKIAIGIYRLRSKMARFLSRLCSLKANLIIIVSLNLQDELPKNVLAKTYLLADGIDLELFSIIPQSQSRQSLSIQKENKIVLFVGSSSPLNDTIKNYKLAEQSFLIVNSKLNNVSLYRISNIPHKMMPLYLNAADVMLVTSISEGSPNVIKEAMACNLPVVAVNCGDIKERLAGVQPSSVVDSYDADCIADSLIKILNTNDRSNGRDMLIYQKLDISGYTKNILSLYNIAIRGLQR